MHVDVHPVLRAAALDSWGLLGSTIPDSEIASKDGRGVAVLPLLQKALDHTDSELRSSAGECFSMIHECRLLLGAAADGENDVSSNDRRFRRGSWDGSEWEILMDEVKQRMAELAVESGHRMSKKAKRSQRSTFREYMSTVVDDILPETTIVFPGGSLNLGSWKEIKQLDFVRSCLQSGFQQQMAYNETLHDIFGADVSVLLDREGASMNDVEKRLFMSKNSSASKGRDKDLKKDRNNRNKVKDYFLTADGEDGAGYED